MSIVEEFFVMNWDGIKLFSYAPDIKDMDQNLITSFFSAVQSFSKEIDHQNHGLIDSLSIGDYSYTFISNANHRLYFVLKTSKSKKKKEIIGKLHEIEKMFINEYQDYLNKFDGDVTPFQKFKIKFEEHFQDLFVKLKGMW